MIVLERGGVKMSVYIEFNLSIYKFAKMINNEHF